MTEDLESITRIKSQIKYVSYTKLLPYNMV